MSEDFDILAFMRKKPAFAYRIPAAVIAAALFVWIAFISAVGGTAAGYAGEQTRGTAVPVAAPLSFSPEPPDVLRLGQSRQMAVIDGGGNPVAARELVYSVSGGGAVSAAGVFSTGYGVTNGTLVTVKAALAADENVFIECQIRIEILAFNSAWADVPAPGENGEYPQPPEISFTLPDGFDTVVVNGEPIGGTVFKPETSGDYEVRFKNSGTSEVTESALFSIRIAAPGFFAAVWNFICGNMIWFIVAAAVLAVLIAADILYKASLRKKARKALLMINGTGFEEPVRPKKSKKKAADADGEEYEVSAESVQMSDKEHKKRK